MSTSTFKLHVHGTQVAGGYSSHDVSVFRDEQPDKAAWERLRAWAQECKALTHDAEDEMRLSLISSGQLPVSQCLLARVDLQQKQNVKTGHTVSFLSLATACASSSERSTSKAIVAHLQRLGLTLNEAQTQALEAYAEDLMMSLGQVFFDAALARKAAEATGLDAYAQEAIASFAGTVKSWDQVGWVCLKRGMSGGEIEQKLWKYGSAEALLSAVEQGKLDELNPEFRPWKNPSARYKEIVHEMEATINESVWLSEEAMSSVLARTVGEKNGQGWLTHMLRFGMIVRKQDEYGRLFYTTGGRYAQEYAVACHLSRLMRTPSSEQAFESAKNAVPDIQRCDGHQMQAVEMALKHPVSAITGGPGCGKTFVTGTILKAAKSQGWRVVPLAPTGKAASRLSAVSGVAASTIHSALNKPFPKTKALYVVDEATMADLEIASKLLAAIPGGAKVLFVGDVDQLPSVGAGAVFRDILASGRIPTTRLETIHRAAQESAIYVNASALIRGNVDALQLDGKGNFVFHEHVETTATQEQILQSYLRHKSAGETCVVLSPMNEKALGVDELNQFLQSHLNPDRGGPKLKGFNTTLQEGDVVMFRKNRANQYKNGQTAILTRISQDQFFVRFEGVEKEVALKINECAKDVGLGYCMTYHRSQGSEFAHVICICTEEHKGMVDKRLLYTAWTRGKQTVEMFGDPEVLKVAANKVMLPRRTQLVKLMQEVIEPQQDGRFVPKLVSHSEASAAQIRAHEMALEQASFEYIPHETELQVAAEFENYAPIYESENPWGWNDDTSYVAYDIHSERDDTQPLARYEEIAHDPWANAQAAAAPISVNELNHIIELARKSSQEVKPEPSSEASPGLARAVQESEGVSNDTVLPEQPHQDGLSDGVRGSSETFAPEMPQQDEHPDVAGASNDTSTLEPSMAEAHGMDVPDLDIQEPDQDEPYDYLSGWGPAHEDGEEAVQVDGQGIAPSAEERPRHTMGL